MSVLGRNFWLEHDIPSPSNPVTSTSLSLAFKSSPESPIQRFGVHVFLHRNLLLPGGATFVEGISLWAYVSNAGVSSWSPISYSSFISSPQNFLFRNPVYFPIAGGQYASQWAQSASGIGSLIVVDASQTETATLVKDWNSDEKWLPSSSNVRSEIDVNEFQVSIDVFASYSPSQQRLRVIGGRSANLLMELQAPTAPLRANAYVMNTDATVYVMTPINNTLNVMCTVARGVTVVVGAFDKRWVGGSCVLGGTRVYNRVVSNIPISPIRAAICALFVRYVIRRVQCAK
jgi:hypothetical protein